MMEFFEAFVAGLFGLFRWPEFGLMLVGTCLGGMVGLLPGIGGAATLVILLPFAYTMTPEHGLALLVSMIAVVTTTGDITSILFGIPGEGTTASTVVDGYPMTRNGESRRALGAAITGSAVGAAFGAFALAASIPFVRPLVLGIGSPEFFMLSLLGISFLSLVSQGSLLKGLIAGGIGLFLATVGIDSIDGTPRYSFDTLFLWDGIGVLPTALGLFAVPEVLALATTGKTSILLRPEQDSGSILAGMRDTVRHRWLVLRCSALGTYIGLLPGMGASISQWVAYAHAVQSSKDQVRFGKGAVEGVLGPASANNSTLGGALIPTLGFGIPGSLGTTILLGAMLSQGIAPGPKMLIPETQGGHLTLTFSLVWIVIVSNLIASGIALAFLRQLAGITRLRGKILFPLLLSFICLGSFAEKNAIEDLLVLAAMGGLGCVMKRLDWPRPPLLLGLILGPIAENKLFLSVNLYGWSWVRRPGVLIILAIILAGLCRPLIRMLVRRLTHRGNADSSPRVANRPDSDSVPQVSTFLFSLFALGGSLAGLWIGRDLSFRVGFFPRAACVLVLVLSLIQVLAGILLYLRRMPAREPTTSSQAPTSERPEIVWWCFGYLTAIWLIGFVIAIPLFTFLFLRFGAREKWQLSFAMAAGCFAFLYGLMSMALHTPFPEGLMFRAIA
jgi:TctA family transporter